MWRQFITFWSITIIEERIYGYFVEVIILHQDKYFIPSILSFILINSRGYASPRVFQPVSFQHGQRVLQQGPDHGAGRPGSPHRAPGGSRPGRGQELGGGRHPSPSGLPEQSRNQVWLGFGVKCWLPFANDSYLSQMLKVLHPFCTPTFWSCVNLIISKRMNDY